MVDSGCALDEITFTMYWNSELIHWYLKKNDKMIIFLIIKKIAYL